MAKGLSLDEDAKSFAEDKSEQWNARKAFCYGIWRKVSRNLIGQVQVKNIVWDVPSAVHGLNLLLLLVYTARAPLLNNLPLRVVSEKCVEA